MKEIIVNSDGIICYKVIILDNSVSFVEEYTSDTSEKHQYKTNHYNVPISDIQHIRYAFAEETIKSQGNLLALILTIIFFIIAIILFCLQIWVGGICTLVASVIMIILGLTTRSPKKETSSQALIIESKDKILYSKEVQLDSDKLFEIINSIREKQSHIE